MLSELLLALAVLGSVRGQVRDDWPCPESAEIAPCVCSKDTDLHLTLDCSEAKDDDQLRAVFKANFPFNDFKELIINQAGLDEYYLTALYADTFGEVFFEQITITGTKISIVEEEAFALSHGSLKTFDISNNRITEFPIETLPNYNRLETFKINNNELPTLPPIESETLRFLHLGSNTPANGIGPDTFPNSPKLEQIFLQSMDLTVIPANTFSALRFLEKIDLSGNKLPELIEYAFNTPSRTVKQIILSNNELTDIHRTAITGLTSSAKVDFRGNKLVELQKETWNPLLQQVSSSDAIDLQENPLVCSCDVYWLVLDSALMNKIDSSTQCVGGELLESLPLDFFQEHCDPPPAAPVP